ncbi:MAG: RHS repeat-associated core domain-containing protein [Chitinophagales bacterium]
MEDDRDAGLYYIRARYYDAFLLGGLLKDPVASSNLYVYGANNPLKNIDRNGQIIETAADVVSLGASVYDFNTDPSLNNGFYSWLGMFVALLPGVPGSWSAKAIKYGAGYSDELFQGGAAVGKKIETGVIPKGSIPLGQWGEQRLISTLGDATQNSKRFNTSDGARIIDHLKDGIAHESKAGLNVKLTSEIKRQILKDKELIRDNAIKGAHWHFWQGADNSVLLFLQQHGIPYTVH